MTEIASTPYYTIWGLHSQYFNQIYTIWTVGSNKTRAALALLKDIFTGHDPIPLNDSSAKHGWMDGQWHVTAMG